MPDTYTALCTYMLTYVLIGRNERPFRVMGRGYVADAPWQEDGGRLPSGFSGPGPRGLRDSWDGCSSLVQVLVAREGQELYELVVGRDTGEEF